MTPRPRWRWWLFCGALELFFRTNRRGWKWPGDLMAWAALPEWFGWEPGDAAGTNGEVPF
jgi:hypothetical protein